MTWHIHPSLCLLSWNCYSIVDFRGKHGSDYHFNPKARIIVFLFYSYPHYSSSHSLWDNFQSEVCLCEWVFIFRVDESLDGRLYTVSQSCETEQCCYLKLINSSIFEHVSKTVHHCWLRLCIIIVICLLATCPYAYIHVCVHAHRPLSSHHRNNLP